MKLAVLFSGGKDSCFALSEAIKHNEISCLLSVISKNSESYMFHVPNIELTSIQAKAMGIPLLTKVSEGEKEKELKDLKELIKEAKTKYKIEGVVTGAVESVYQSTRVQDICNDLDLWCFNPLWQKDQVELLNNLVDNNFEVMITGIFAYPLNEDWLGKKINKEMVHKLKKIHEKYKINPAGEGGEIETTVLNAPLFKKKLVVTKYKKTYSNYSGIFKIEGVELK